MISKFFVSEFIKKTMINSLKLLFLIIAIGLFSCKNSTELNNNELKDTLANPQDELTMLNKSITENPDDAELKYKRSNVYLSMGKVNEAMNDIRKALLIDSSKAAYFVTLADVYFAQGEPSKTKLFLEKAIAMDETHVEGYLKLAELYFFYRKYNESLTNTRKALKHDQQNAKAYFIQGMNFKEMNAMPNAIKSFQKAIDFDPQYYKAFIELGFIYAENRDPLAAAYFQGALNIQPKSVEALYALAMFYQNTEQIEKAYQTYDILVEADSTFKYAYYNKGYLKLVYDEDYKTAILFFEKAIRLDPQYFEAYYNTGLAYEMMKQYAEARKYYKKSLEIETNYPKAIEGLNRLDALN